jgi:hypothetical protein
MNLHHPLISHKNLQLILLTFKKEQDYQVRLWGGLLH